MNNPSAPNQSAPVRLPFFVAALLLFAAALCSVAAWAQTPAEPPPASRDAVAPRVNVDMLAEITKSGKLRVGLAEIVPWAMHDRDGKLIGLSVDVARKLARDLGVEAEFHPVAFPYLIPDLLANRYDIIVSGFSIVAERALQVNYSAPYYETDVTLAANLKTAGSFKTLQDFNKDSLTIGVLHGTTAEEMAAKLLPDAKLKTYVTDSTLFDDLTRGKIDAAVADSPRPELVARFFPQSVIFPGIKLSTFPTAFAVRRGDMDFVNYLNSWIASRTADGWIAERLSYWFKASDWSKNL
jgi:polar amino acid transport system substrate-binding protein